MAGWRFAALIAGLAFAFFAALSARPRSAEAQWVQPNIATTTIARYWLYMQTGREYELETVLIGSADPVMHLLDGNNFEVAQNDDYAPPNRNSRIFYTPPVTGYYVVVVRSYSTLSTGNGAINWTYRTLPSGPWQAWNVLTSATHYGGAIVPIQPGQREYRTRMARPTTGVAAATPDTVLYTMDYNGRITKFDDDGGVGYMERLIIGLTSYPTYSLLVGAYSVAGSTDLIANDALDSDGDADGVGTGLEGAIGTCDGLFDTAPRCKICVTPPCPPNAVRNIINYKDSDHDGLYDDIETFGKDWPSDKTKALHLPAWGADARRKDVFIEQDFSTGYPNGSANPFTYARAQAAREKFCGTADPAAECVYPTQQEILNLVGGGTGIHLHFDIGSSGDPCPDNRTLCGAWGGGGTRTDSQELSDPRKGVFRHLRIDPGQGGGAHVASKTFFVGDGRFDKDLVHELGHSLGLTHGGHWKWDFDTVSPYYGADLTSVASNGKPQYPSLMNYGWFFLPWADFNFSRGANTAVIDPGNVSETLQAFSTPAKAAHLAWDDPTPTLHKLPRADATYGRGDWNRDNAISAGVTVRGSILTGGRESSAHRLSMVEAPTYTDYGAATPDLAALYGSQKLYAFFATSNQRVIGYRPVSHGGNSTAGGCLVGSGRIWEPCHSFSGAYFLPYVMPEGVVITAVTALEWGGQMVVAWRTSDRVVRVARSTGVDTSTGELTGWPATPTQITTDADSADVELAPMYVTANSSNGFGYPKSNPPSEDSQLLALFYTTGLGAASAHKFRYATPGDVLASWTVRTVSDPSGNQMSGEVAPGVAVWPARSNAPGADNHIALGYACGMFSKRLGTGAHVVESSCYSKATDRWARVATATGVGALEGRKPPFAFHTLRRADGVPIDERKGQFWTGTTSSLGAVKIMISEEVSVNLLPSTDLRFHAPEDTWDTELTTGVNYYADRDVSALKTLALYRYGNPVRKRLELQGLFDGSFRAELKDGNDFHVMEHGICRGLHVDAPSSICGTVGYYNYGYTEAP